MVGCHADDGARVSSQSTADSAPEARKIIWDKPTVDIQPGDPSVPLIVRLYEVRHDRLGKRRPAVDQMTVLEGAPDRGLNQHSGVVRRIKSDDKFLAELDSWCRASEPQAVLIKTLPAPAGEFVRYEWDVPADRKPRFGRYEFEAARLDDGRIRLRVGTYHPHGSAIINGVAVPGLMNGGGFDVLDISADQSIAAGGLTIRRPITPKLKRQGLSLETVTEETVELLAVISLAPDAKP
jgi:hypothetical protein